MIEKICPFCEKVFDEELIKDHIGIEHLGLESGAFHSSNEEISEATFDCKDCDEKFTNESDLKIHQNIAHPSFKYDCEKCDKRFLSERSLKMHLKVLHSNEKQESSKTNPTISVKLEVLDLDLNKNKCKKCAKVFSNKM